MEWKFSLLYFRSANFMDMQQRMQQELMRNPQTMRQLMDNPMVQQLMSNPDIMRNLITSNPQMQELMEVSWCDKAMLVSLTKSTCLFCHFTLQFTNIDVFLQ